MIAPAGGGTRRPLVTVIGLGPAGPELLTAATVAAIESVPVRFLRTARHPAAVAVTGAASFDHLYVSAASIENVYPAIVSDLVAAATSDGSVLYAVPGSPAVAEHTVELLRAEERVDTVVVPALSCVDLAWVRLGIDPLAAGARIVDGHRFEVEAAGERGPLLVLQCDTDDVLSRIKLAGRGGAVTVLARLGLPEETIATVAWDEIDRIVPDHMTSLWIEEMAEPVGRELVRFDELVRLLRRRCPWDRAQTHASLRRYVVEEAYEVLEAIDSMAEEGYEHLEEELGDLLFQVYFHSALAAEEGHFTVADVARGIHDKLVRRHPHVFGEVDATTLGQVSDNWDAIKRGERGKAGVMDGIPGSLPALLYAQKAQRRAASAGFNRQEASPAWSTVSEGLAGVIRAGGDVEAEVGDLLFACADVARGLGIDAEVALRSAIARFRLRIGGVELLAAARGVDVRTAGPAALDVLWDEVGGAPGR